MKGTGFRVTLDIEMIRTSASDEDGVEHSRDYVLASLEADGFEPLPDGGWLVAQEHVCAVDPAKILTIQPA